MQEICRASAPLAPPAPTAAPLAPRELASGALALQSQTSFGQPATAPQISIAEAAEEAGVATTRATVAIGDGKAETPNVAIHAPDTNAARPNRKAAISDPKITAQDANVPIPDNNVPI